MVVKYECFRPFAQRVKMVFHFEGEKTCSVSRGEGCREKKSDKEKEKDCLVEIGEDGRQTDR